MSYCVNCGVELDETAASCPLCSTSVHNPNIDKSSERQPPYSDRVVLPPSTQRRFVAYIISVAMLIPNVVCILANLLFDKSGTWSFYIAASSALVWVLAVFPFFTQKRRPYLLWGFDSLAVCAYTYFFFAIDGNSLWFLRCALPVIGAVSLFALVYLLWYRRKKRGRTLCVIHFLSDAVVLSLVVGAEISYYYSSFNPLYVSLIVASSLLIMLLFLIYCDKSRRMKAWLSRNFFVE